MIKPSQNTAVRAKSARGDQAAYAKNEGTSRALQGESSASTPATRAATRPTSVMALVG